MPFTQDELDQSIEKVVRSSIRFEYDNLGTRKLGTTFNDVQDAAAGVFVAYPNAAFYVAKLAANRLVELVQAEAEAVGELIRSVRSVGRNVSPVRKLSFLANAKTALAALASATGQRAGAFTELEGVPAYQRFDLNTQRFLDAEGKNVRQDGDVVPTPQEARASLAGLANELQSSHDELVRRATLLMGCIDDFGSLNLPERLSQGIMQRAHDVLSSRLGELEARDPESRLEVIRSVVLDVLTARATVRGFGSLSPQGLFLKLTGSGGPFASAELPATPAVLQADELGPYSFFEGQDKLRLLLDGTDTVTFQLPHSFVPFLQVPARGPFTLEVPANQFKISLTGFADVSVVVTPTSPATVDPWDVVDLINAAVTVQPLEAHLDFIPIKTTQAVNIEVTASPNDVDFFLNPAVGTWASLGVVVGDRVLVRDPTSTMDDDIFEIVSFTDPQRASTNIVRAGALVDENAKTVQLGTDAAVIWTVGVETASAQAALDNHWVLRFEDVEVGTLQKIGVFSGSQVTAIKTTSQVLENFFNTTATASINGVPRLTAASTFVETRSSKARTVPAVSNKLVLHTFRGTGDITLGGLTATFVLPGLLAGELSPGDLLVIRETATAADMDAVGVVATVVGTTVTATFSSPVTADVGTLVEGGPSTAGLVDQTVVVATGGPQDGTYSVLAAADLELTLSQTVVATTDFGGQPYLLSSVSVGRYRLDLSSLDTSLSSALQAQAAPSADASAELYSLVPKSAVASSVYFQLPETPANLEPGDQLEIHNSSVATPDLTRVVKELSGGGVVELEVAVDATQPVITFTQGSPVPFARVRKRVKQSFSELAEALGVWLENYTAPKLLGYFRQLYAFLNALVINQNPTPAQVNDTVIHLQTLLGKLTIAGATSTGFDPLNSLESALENYSADLVPQVDALLSAYDQKGADRARALLLEGQFTTFFGLDRDGVSYAGYAQKLLKDVSRLDLPVRKTDRLNSNGVGQDNQLASWEDTDFEFTPEDLDPSESIDIPGEGDLAPNIPIP